MTPWLSDQDVTLYHGDCLEVLRELPDASVQMCATSPPFYGLRDYGTGTWEGGDPACDHLAPPQGGPTSGPLAGTGHRERGKDVSYGPSCGKCGAIRVDHQVGLEASPEAWVEKLVAVFAEVRRVLRDYGTLWVEIGDSYSGGDRGKYAGDGDRPQTKTGGPTGFPTRPVLEGVKAKDLLGQPWMLAFALRADGWYLRSEIIWHRPNPMPESTRDRPTKAHSTVFLLSKRPRYFYDPDAIREAFASTAGSGNVARKHGADVGAPGGTNGDLGRSIPWSPPPQAPQWETLGNMEGEAPRGPDGRWVTGVQGGENSEQHRDGERWPNPAGANARSVWTLATEPTPFAHFATWPQKLVARMIQAGTSERGCCAECGAPWVRQVAKAEGGSGQSWNDHENELVVGQRQESGLSGDEFYGSWTPPVTLGWQPSCAHGGDPVPCVVLDPFSGSGTTSLVARNHGRRSIGIELNAEYLAIASGRLAQQSLLA